MTNLFNYGATNLTDDVRVVLPEGRIPPLTYVKPGLPPFY